MKIFVTGAGGFVGRNLIPALLAKGHVVSAWKHRQESDLGVHHERLTSSWGDLAGPAEQVLPKLKEAMQGCRAVVHLAAKTSEAPSDANHSASVNIEGAERLLACAKELGVYKFVYVSTQSAKITRAGSYGATKKKAEELVLKSGLNCVILRPAIIYGPGKAGIFTKFVNLVEKLPILPIPWTNVTFQPVLIDDVVGAIASAVEDKPLQNQFFDVAGPDSVSFPGLIRAVAKARGMNRILLPVPMKLAMAGAVVLSKVMKKPPVTIDNLIGLTEVTPIDLAPMKRELGIAPMPLEAGLKKTFEVN